MTTKIAFNQMGEEEVSRGASTTLAEKTLYVSPVGNDVTGDGSAANPFESLQRAVDAIPDNVHHRQTIQLMDGTHTAGSRDTNPIPGASTIRSVRCLVDNKNVNGRDMIVIQGNTTDKSLTTIQHNDVYSAVYVEETNGVVIKDVTIDCSSNTAAAISIFQHRKGDMRVVDVSATGNDMNGTQFAVAETGAFIEFAGDISATNYERGLVSLEAVISFIGSSLTHDGGTATAPRTFEAGNGGRVDYFTGALTATNIQRLVFCKDSSVLVSASSSSITATGFILDVDSTGHIKAVNVNATGAARGVSAVGGHVEIQTCNFTDQTTSAVVATEGATVIIDDCSLTDSTITKPLVDVESSTLIIKGDGDINGGFRGVFAKNSTVQIEEQMNFLNSAINLDLRHCATRIEGSVANPVTINNFTTNAINLDGGSCGMTYINIPNTASLVAVLAKGCQIVNEGGVNIYGGGLRGFDLSQNASLTADTTVGSDLTGMIEGVNVRRGAQFYYRTSSMDFTGTTTPTVEDIAKSAHVTAF
jgi:hypothetical protein